MSILVRQLVSEGKEETFPTPNVTVERALQGDDTPLSV